MIYFIIIGVIVYFLFFRSSTTDQSSSTGQKTADTTKDLIAEKYKDYATFTISIGTSPSVSDCFGSMYMHHPRYFAKDGKIIECAFGEERVAGYYYSKETTPVKKLKSLVMNPKTMSFQQYSTDNMGNYKYYVTDTSDDVYGFVCSNADGILSWHNYEGMNSADFGKTFITTYWYSSDKSRKEMFMVEPRGDRYEAAVAFLAFMEACSKSGNMHSWNWN